MLPKTKPVSMIASVVATEESTGRFLWSGGQPTTTVEFRPAQSENDRRGVDEISIAELIGLVQREKELLSDSDPAVALARSIGLARLSQSARDRIEEAIRLARK